MADAILKGDKGVGIVEKECEEEKSKGRCLWRQPGRVVQLEVLIGKNKGN